MPFTHVEIEQRKSRNIALLYLTLAGMYAGSLLVLTWAIGSLSGFGHALRGAGGAAPGMTVRLLAIVGLSLIFSAGHWLASTDRLLARVLGAIGAHAADPRDTYHARFANIVSEVSIATGGRAIDPYVIPTTAVNACTAVDMDGRAAIAVTEGALARLSRAQLEAVVGHEAGHIVSGDSLITSIFCGLFALHEEALKRMGGFLDVEGRGSGQAHETGTPVILLVVIVLWLTQQMKRVCEMCISREKEYRADAIAVRLTRDPLGLAEALRLISRRWRGVGMRGESLSSLFILDPGAEPLSEQEGLVAELWSTHPPTVRRIENLLGMACVDPARFEETMSRWERRPHARRLPSPVPTDSGQGQWMVWEHEQWIGPVSLAAAAGMLELVPETWVKRIGDPAVEPAHRDPDLLEMFRRRYAAADGSLTNTECPNCRVGLASITYEGAPIDRCPACQGCYVDPDMLTKVFSREEYDFPEDVKRIGDLLLSLKGYLATRRRAKILVSSSPRWPCPRCGAAVLKKFYTDSYLVEVEQCWECGLTWLDRGELELLQYLYERRQALDDIFNRDSTRPPSADRA